MIPLIAGFAAGMAGAMGLGGGFVLMVYLSWTGMNAPEARAANLMFFIPTALVSMLINRRNTRADTPVIPYAAAAGSVGVVAGLMLAGALDTGPLNKVFGFLIAAVGVKELFHRRQGEEKRRAAPHTKTKARMR